jgi:hypothetical protein
MRPIQRLEDLNAIELPPHPFPWPRDSWIPIAAGVAFSALSLCSLAQQAGWSFHLLPPAMMTWFGGWMLASALSSRRYWRLVGDLRSDLAQREGESTHA